MKKEIAMKKYVIDQLLQLMIFWGSWFYLNYKCGYAFFDPDLWMYAIILFILNALGVFACGLFKHILLLPFDLLRGSSEQIAYFSKRVGIDNYECLGKKYYCEWKFYSSQGTLQVLVPVFLTEEKIREMEKPQVDQKVKLNYYKYSKILRSWEVVGDSKLKR